MGLHHDLSESIRCVFFFGTPHQGLLVAELEKAVGGDADSGGAFMLPQLKDGSEYLENQKEALGRLWKEFHGKVVTFYGTKSTGPDRGVRRYHLHHAELSCIFPYAWRFKADINSWRPDRSNGERKSKWCNDCPLSFIYLGNLAIHSTQITQIW